MSESALIRTGHELHTTNVEVDGRYIYGTYYIDEVVQQHNFTTTGAQSTYQVLQDANWDVIALTNLSGTLAEQYALDPYGKRFAAERVNANGTLTTLDPLTGAATLLTSNGLFLNPYTGNLENRARTLNARLLRMNQRDPNESALILTSSMALHGQSRFLGLSVNGSAQYQDGMSLYQYLRGNPITGTDSSGFFAYFDQIMSASTQAQLGTQYLDPAASTVDAMKGVAFLASDRNRAMDDLLGTESQEYDFSRIDTALEIYDTIQMTQMTLLGVGAAKSVLKAGARFFKGMARRLGGLRTRIVEALERGHNAVERLIGRGEGWLKHLHNSGGHIFERHVGRSDSYLLGRLQRRTNIDRAST